MARAGGGAPGDAGREGSAAAGPFSFSPEPTLEDIRRLHAEFAAERDWEQFHQPRNLLLALVGEVGELAELFQWKSDAEPGPQAWPPKERAALQEELSDVLIYLVALAARCRVDLPQAVISKMDTNRRRYPVHLSRGSACKYTDLPRGTIPESQAVDSADPAPELRNQAST
ncbi:dCTP pyrophosphatase 1 [Psammomys obesus]|uniref:dCTP pyrophosphatase 1 n=1 Tax=Psammomys obesus TaxID=48139 RepID=UPI002452CD7D|nr:dCTP pyrophosphatase 1 [Psammomys obesus]